MRWKNELKRLQLEVSDMLPFMLELFSFKETGVDPSFKTPDLVKERIIEHIIQIALKISEGQPLVLIVEDLHWIDRNSEELLRDLLEGIPASKVMVISTYRPEFHESWGRKSYHNQLNLNQLSNREGNGMIHSLLNTEIVDPKFEELVLGKAEGNPFYIEELVKSMIDLSFIEKEGESYMIVKNVDDVNLPSTIQNIIMARVDRLPEETREVLLMGCVIEREFEFPIIKHLTDYSEADLIAQLSILKDSELLYERGIAPKAVYIFKHALTRDVIYDSILGKNKKVLHEKVGNAILEVYQDRIELYYEVLADHFTRSENYGIAADYWRFASSKAAQANLVLEAIYYCEQQAFCLEKLPQTKSVQKKRVHATITSASYHLFLNHHFQAKEAIDSVMDQIFQNDYQQRLPIIYIILGTYNNVEDNVSEAIKYLINAIDVCKKNNDYQNIAPAQYFLATISTFNSKFDDGIYYFRQAFELAELGENSSFACTIKSSISLFYYFPTGKADLAIKFSNEALELAARSSKKSKGIAYASYGGALWAKHDFEKGIGFLFRSKDICIKSGHYSWSLLSLQLIAMIHMEKKEFGLAEKALNLGSV